MLQKYWKVNIWAFCCWYNFDVLLIPVSMNLHRKTYRVRFVLCKLSLPIQGIFKISRSQILFIYVQWISKTMYMLKLLYCFLINEPNDVSIALFISACFYFGFFYFTFQGVCVCVWWVFKWHIYCSFCVATNLLKACPNQKKLYWSMYCSCLRIVLDIFQLFCNRAKNKRNWI